MGASSVTGVSGAGDSEGLYKAANTCGCGCSRESEEPVEPVRLGCYVKHVAGNQAKYIAGGGATKITVC